jgi:Mn-dependent DtxR family transcriptional regulator
MKEGIGMDELSIAMQHYLETIYNLSCQGKGVRVSDIAKTLGVSKASVNNAINVLSDHCYVSRKKYQEVYLTPQEIAAAELLENTHSLLKTLFVSVIGVPKKIADRDACAIEHIISRETITNIRKYLQKNGILPNAGNDSHE